MTKCFKFLDFGFEIYLGFRILDLELLVYVEQSET
jgi:hypothetical protein